MKTADLTGALLDYWTARAEGVPAAELEIRQAARPGDPRSPDEFCIHWRAEARALALHYSTNWSMGGPLMEKYRIDVHACVDRSDWVGVIWPAGWHSYGDTPLIAICRAVVRAAFGDEVEDLP